MRYFILVILFLLVHSRCESQQLNGATGIFISPDVEVDNLKINGIHMRGVSKCIENHGSIIGATITNSDCSVDKTNPTGAFVRIDSMYIGSMHPTYAYKPLDIVRGRVVFLEATPSIPRVDKSQLMLQKLKVLPPFRVKLIHMCAEEESLIYVSIEIGESSAKYRTLNGQVCWYIQNPEGIITISYLQKLGGGQVHIGSEDR